MYNSLLRCKNNHRRVGSRAYRNTRTCDVRTHLFIPIEHDRYKLDLRVPIDDPIFTRLSTPLCNLDNWYTNRRDVYLIEKVMRDNRIFAEMVLFTFRNIYFDK